MFVKMYQYHISLDKVDEYLYIQQQAKRLYNKYIRYQSTHLNSNKDRTKWIELSIYESEEVYQSSITFINQEKEIQSLYRQFESIVIDRSEIKEEDFTKYQL
ncbi:hypothetical protein JOC54_004300 [Alkalihalobacillus xiaoxiensis]|uniref:Antibiotic biosynthesis monooxygenase n=1 Tax=Shouchella xiaoxiensis TaxID=766895 RepID=A0ABS2T170_9BACI|nr:hypothetical protein [Shouchella xiaoxiensis]MBM7841001.1 hypothetical protein [Shouchella xiaoxiensis]